MLAEKDCVPCRGGVPPLTKFEAEPLLAQLRDWRMVEYRRLTKSYKFDNFAKPMSFACKIAELAEQQAHHPDLLIRWGELAIELWTHKVDGLTESDFILAAKIDKLAAEEKLD